MTDRRFQHRITPGSLSGILLLLLLAFYLFWNRSAVAAFAVVAVLVAVMERVLHTSYTLTGKELIVSRGRFARTLTIPLTDVIECRKMRTTFGLSHYLLLSYGANHLLSLQPDNEAAFLSALSKRLREH